MSYTFIDSDLHDARKLLSLLGSFWSDCYQGVDQVVAHCISTGEAGYQASIDLAETINSVGRPTVPVHHTEQWYVHYLRASDKGVAPLRYGGPSVGDFGDGRAYGGPGGAPGYSWECPVASVDLIFNRIYDPSATLTRGLDFRVADGRLVFATDPFADPRFAVRTVTDDRGDEVDRELALWLFRSSIDQEHIWTHFGYIMGIRLESSLGYKGLVNALLDAITGCTATEQLNGMLAAVTGCEFARGDEVVEEIVRGRELLVITDVRAYRYVPACTPLVAVGDTLRNGDVIVDTVETHYLNHGTTPPWLTSLSLSDGLLLPGYLSDLTFADGDAPLIVKPALPVVPGFAPTADNYAKVSWALAGFPADVAEFWDDTHRRGFADGTTLAHLLDLRENPVGEPTAANLPATINPLTFLAANYLRHNALLVRIRTGGFGPRALGLSQLRHLRRIIPPHELVLIVIEMPVVEDSAIVDQVEEALLSYSAAEPIYEPVELDLIGDGPIGGGTVLGTCYAEAYA